MNLSHVLFVFSIFVAQSISYFHPTSLLKGKANFNRGRNNNQQHKDSSSWMYLRGGQANEFNTQLDSDSDSDSDSNSPDKKAILMKSHQESLELYHRFRSCKDGFIMKQLNSALDILYDALRLYGPQQLFSSFNGGKDAVVIMHLLRAVTAKYSDEQGIIYRPNLVYFAIKDEFPEVLAHIDESEEMYCLNLTRYDTAISQGLSEHITRSGNGKGVAFVLGTRKGDPNCGNQQHFAPSR